MIFFLANLTTFKLKGDTYFSGWIQDVRIITIPLTNSEILNLYGKSKYSVRIQPECRCPNEFPRNENENSVYCLPNSVDLNNRANKKNRLNEFSHNTEFINDGDFKTSWISCILNLSGPITIAIDLFQGVFVLQRIEIFFTSLPPTNLILQSYYQQKWSRLQTYSINCPDSDEKCTSLPMYLNNFPFKIASK